MSDIGPWQYIVVHHARDAFGSGEEIARQWRALNFTAAPDYSRAVDQYERFVELLRTSGAEIVLRTPHSAPRTPHSAPRTPHSAPSPAQPKASYEDKKRADAEARRKRRTEEERQTRIGELEQRIAAHETEIKALEARMADPAFYDDRATADAAVTRHQLLMWEVGDLMNSWEALQDS